MKPSRWFLFCAFQVAIGCDLLAQPVPSREPTSTHIFPAGGRRGEVVRVLVGAECIPPQTGFQVWGSGIEAPAVLGPRVAARIERSPRREPREVPICYPKEWEATVSISAQAELGPSYWRLTCARGGTGSRPFIVGDLPEYLESESNSVPASAERVQLPVTLNGRIAGESDLDYYIFTLRAGDVVLCDTVAGRIGSPLDPVLDVIGPDSRRLAVSELRIGSDPVIAFRADQNGDHRLLVSNVSFHGTPAHVYRITLQSVACDQTIISPELIGQWISNQQPSSHSALPLGGGESLSADPSALGKPSQSNATRLAVPQTIRGTLASSEEQWFQFVAQKGGSVTVTCHPIPSGIAAMPEILLVDTDGKPLAECKSTDGAGRDCRLVWKAVTDGQVQVRLRNAARGGPLRTMPYELTLCQASPDFELSVKQDSVNIVPGGRSELAVAVTRTVMDGPIDIAVTGLPDGVRAEPAKIAANQDFAKLVLVADATARPCDTPIQIKGQVAIDTMTMERTAQAQHLGRDVTGASIGSPTTDQLFLTVQHKPVFRLYCNEAYQYAHRGTIYPYAMQVERLDGFNGEITIQLGDRQNRDLDGIEFREVIVPPGQTEVQLPIYLPETMHINTLSQSQIYAQAYARFIDQWGTPQSTLVVSEKRNMIRTLPTVAKLSAQQPTVRAMPGRPVSCILTLDRSSNFCGEVEVELVDPPAGFLAEKTRMADGESKVEMIVHTSARTERVHSPSLRFRASGELTPGVAVVSEASIELVVE